MLIELIKWLKKQDQNKSVPYGFGEPHAFGGYLEQCAFVPKENVTYGEMLAYAESALGATFIGFEGRRITMREYSKCYISKKNDFDNADMIGQTIMKFWKFTEI